MPLDAHVRIAREAPGFYALPVRLLCISDIHGHADALGAVLATAERWGYTRLLVAGDLVFPGSSAEYDAHGSGIDPLETWRRLMQANAACVQGVTDRALATLDLDRVRPRSDHERARLDRVADVRKQLGDVILARLARLPLNLRIPLEDGRELLLVHGSPHDPTEPFTHDMTDEEVNALLGDDPADIIVCGGSHVPFDRTVMGARIINVGSVGEAPAAASAAHADAVIVEVTAASTDVKLVTIPLGKAA
jgi:predicted phosphodiesterase